MPVATCQAPRARRSLWTWLSCDLATFRRVTGLEARAGLLDLRDARFAVQSRSHISHPAWDLHGSLTQAWGLCRHAPRRSRHSSTNHLQPATIFSSDQPRRLIARDIQARRSEYTAQRTYQCAACMSPSWCKSTSRNSFLASYCCTIQCLS